MRFKGASGQSISRILSSNGARPRAWAVIYLASASPRRSSSLPGTGLLNRRHIRKRARFPLVLRPLRPCLTLLPAGVTRPPVLLRTPVVSYTTFSLSPRPCERGYLFSVALSGRLAPHRSDGSPRPGYYPTPCSVECGLSSIP